jgi:hypothetical protein
VGGHAGGVVSGDEKNLEFNHMVFAFIPIKGLESLAKLLRNSC